MKINEIKKETLTTLLSELLNLDGAKEIFEKYDIEVINFSTEKAAFEKLIKEFDKKVKESKAIKEYKQAVSFLNLQINTNREALKTAEGFVKNMIESMLQTFESSKNTTKDMQSVALRNELVGLENIVLNDNDKEVVKELLTKIEITKEEDFVEQVEELIKKAKERYSKDIKETEDIKEEPKKVETKKADKEVIKKDNEKLHKEIVKELDNIEKKEEKAKEVEKELDDLDLGVEDDEIDLNDIEDIEVEEEIKKDEKEVKKETKKKEKAVEKKEEIDDLKFDGEDLNDESEDIEDISSEIDDLDLSDIDGFDMSDDGDDEGYNPFL